MPRVVMLGCGTGIGKTRVSAALLRALTAEGANCLGLKPVESGMAFPQVGATDDSDAHALASAASLHAPRFRRPLYALRDPVSPHLAARRQGLEITITAVRTWVETAERAVTPLVVPNRATWCIIETAGGAFSPLSAKATNFDLAVALEPAVWVLVAADALGVLHDVSATLQAMKARGRTPDHVVLSCARPPDASTGSNACELAALGIVTPIAVLERDDDRGIQNLLRRLLADQHSRT